MQDGRRARLEQDVSINGEHQQLGERLGRTVQLTIDRQNVKCGIISSWGGVCRQCAHIIRLFANTAMGAGVPSAVPVMVLVCSCLVIESYVQLMATPDVSLVTRALCHVPPARAPVILLLGFPTSIIYNIS